MESEVDETCVNLMDNLLKYMEEKDIKFEYTKKDAEKLLPKNITENDVINMCLKIPCKVNMRKRNLYYKLEHTHRIYVKIMDLKPKQRNKYIVKKINSNFKFFYNRHFLEWQKRHDELKDVKWRVRVINHAKFLKIYRNPRELLDVSNVLSSEDEEAEEARITSKTGETEENGEQEVVIKEDEVVIKEEEQSEDSPSKKSDYAGFRVSESSNDNESSIQSTQTAILRCDMISSNSTNELTESLCIEEDIGAFAYENTESSYQEFNTSLERILENSLNRPVTSTQQSQTQVN